MAHRRFVSACVAWLVLALALAWLSVAAHGAGPIGPDLRLARWMQSGPGWWEQVADVTRFFGERLWSSAVLLGVCGPLWKRFGRLSRVVPALFAIVVLVFVVQVELKNVVDRPRPDAALVDRRAGFDSESFPSGHVLTGTVSYGLAAVTLFAIGSKRARTVGAILLVPPAMNLWANTYLGVHWPTDSLGGLVAAALFIIPVSAIIVPRLRSP